MALTQVFFRYKDSGRAAVGLSVVKYIGGVAKTTTITNALGWAAAMEAGATLKVWRGAMRFDLSPTVPNASNVTFEIEPNQWPTKLREMRNLLKSSIKDFYDDGGSATIRIDIPLDGRAHARDPSLTARATPIFFPVKDRLIDAANRTLSALSDRGDIEELINPTFIDRGETRDENPMIVSSALMISMAISRLFSASMGRRKNQTGKNADIEKARVRATKAGILGIIHWLNHRQHPNEPGYFVRWRQSDWESRAGRNWLAEPSLDEYSGLLMGLRWLRNLGTWGPTPGNRWQAIVDFEVHRFLREIEAYLISTKGWLVRPNNGDMTIRGPNLFLNTYPLNRMFSSYQNWKIFDIGDYEKRMINKSIQSFNAMDSSSNPSMYKNYKGSIKLGKTLKQIEDGTKWGIFAAAAIGVAGLLTGGGALAIVAGLGALGIGIGHDQAVKKINSWQFWKLCARGLGKDAGLDAGGFNTHIFDRFSLAAMWEADRRIKEAFFERSTRRIGGDDNGWMSLGIACRVWMGDDKNGNFNPREWVTLLLSDADALAPPPPAPVRRLGLRPLEGFILGWPIIALALDIDPEIQWEKYIKERVTPHDEPVEIG